MGLLDCRLPKVGQPLHVDSMVKYPHSEAQYNLIIELPPDRNINLLTFPASRSGDLRVNSNLQMMVPSERDKAKSDSGLGVDEPTLKIHTQSSMLYMGGPFRRYCDLLHPYTLTLTPLHN